MPPLPPIMRSEWVTFWVAGKVASTRAILCTELIIRAFEGTRVAFRRLQTSHFPRHSADLDSRVENNWPITKNFFWKILVEFWCLGEHSVGSTVDVLPLSITFVLDFLFRNQTFPSVFVAVISQHGNIQRLIVIRRSSWDIRGSLKETIRQEKILDQLERATPTAFWYIVGRSDETGAAAEKAKQWEPPQRHCQSGKEVDQNKQVVWRYGRRMRRYGRLKGSLRRRERRMRQSYSFRWSSVLGGLRVFDQSSKVLIFDPCVCCCFLMVATKRQ